MTLLFVASTGGHLAELHALAPRLGATEHDTWVTFDTPQSRAL
ncbi:MAG: glycosyltransferase 28 domain protein, partial [Thermoleophilia bacterium]|nr:glycosyltransferase 28 domain protein [Thermoleophilia bacterium]